MRRSIPARLLSTAQLTRLTMAVGGVGDVWFTVLFSRSQEEYSFLPVDKLPLWFALATSALVAAGLFTFAASLNDLLDARHDGTFAPERPIPASRLRPATVGIVTASALIVALLGAIPLGTGALVMTLLVSAGILFYNAAGKHIPGIGVVAIGIVTALHMLIPNFELTFTLPVWLTMTHATAITLTSYLLLRKRPHLSRRSFLLIGIGYASCSLAILFLGWYQGRGPGWWPPESSPFGLIWPTLTVAAFAWVAWRKTAGIPPRAAAEKLGRYGVMWQCLYAGSWLLAVGLYDGALLLFALAIVGFSAMSLIKEVGSLVISPPHYRV